MLKDKVLTHLYISAWDKTLDVYNNLSHIFIVKHKIMKQSINEEFRRMQKLAGLINESLRSGPNDAYTYPLKNGDNPEDILSGKSRGSWEVNKSVSDLLDVFGNEMSLYKGDSVEEFLQVNSKDSGAYVYKIVRRDLRGSRVVGYIPSLYRDFDQTDEVRSSAR